MRRGSNGSERRGGARPCEGNSIKCPPSARGGGGAKTGARNRAHGPCAREKKKKKKRLRNWRRKDELPLHPRPRDIFLFFFISGRRSGRRPGGGGGGGGEKRRGGGRVKKKRENGAGEAEEERRGDFLNRAGVVEWSGG